MQYALSVVNIFTFMFTSVLWATDSESLKLPVPIQQPSVSRDSTLDPNATHISRAAEQKSHAFKNALEMFALLVVSNADSLAVRAITPIRIGNGSIGFTLEAFQHNLPFINASEFNIFFPTQDSQQKMSALIAKAAQKQIPLLSKEDQSLLVSNAYLVIHAKTEQRQNLSNPNAPLPGDETQRTFVVGTVSEWQEKDPEGKFLGYMGGYIIPLTKF